MPKDTLGLTIERGFEFLLPVLSEDELKTLKANVIRQGAFRDRLAVWKRGDKTVLLDGHHRFKVWLELPENTPIAPPETIEVKLKSKSDAISWIVENQIGRRNFTPQRAAYNRGADYQAHRGKPTDNESGDETAVKGNGRNKLQDATVVQTVAKRHEVTERSVYRDSAYKDAIDAIITVNRQFGRQLLDGKVKLPRGTVCAISSSGDIGRAIRNLKSGREWDDGIIIPAPAEPAAAEETPEIPAKKRRPQVKRKTDSGPECVFDRAAQSAWKQNFGGLMRSVDSWYRIAGETPGNERKRDEMIRLMSAFFQLWGEANPGVKWN